MQVAIQNTNQIFPINYVKLNKTDTTYNILGKFKETDDYLILGSYKNYILATHVYVQLLKQFTRMFKGGPYYNIYEMPPDIKEGEILL